MQGSFWKTVALVAVIGVGSLAILEVQNRLKNSPSALESSAKSEDLSLAAELLAVNENSVDAELSESEFDRMLKAGFPPSEQQRVASNAGSSFDLSEPDAEGGQTFDTSSEDLASQFSLVDVDQQAGSVETADASEDQWETGTPFAEDKTVQLANAQQVDTNVDADFLTESPNPFTAAGETAENAGAIEQSNDNVGKIQPAGYVADESPSSDDSSGSAFAAFDPAEFGAAGAATDAGNANTSATDKLKMPLGEQGLAARQVGQLEFFAGDNRPGSVATNARTVDASTVAFGQELPPGQLGDSPGLGGGFEEFSMDDADMNSLSGSSSPFPGFEAESVPSSGPLQLPGLPSTDGNGVEERAPFFEEEPALESPRNDELVPMPRDRFDGPSFDSGSSSRGSFDDAATDSESLPFVEDAGSDVPFLNPVPDPQRDDGLSIPRSDLERGTDPVPRSFDDGRFDSQPSNSGAGRDREFNTLPESDPRRPDPFDSRSFDRNTPEITPIDSDPFDPINPGSEGPGLSIDRQDRTFGNERFDGSETRGINPGFDSEPGRIPMMEDRRDDLRFPVGNSPGDNTPLTIDPGFGSGLSGTGRDNEDLDRDSRPVREFGGSDRSRDFPTRPSSEIAPYGGTQGGSGPVGSRRELGGSSFDRRQDDLQSVDDRMRGNVRQIASVMRPKLTLEKSAPKNATVGTPLQYSIIVRNDGDAPAYDVVIEDEVTATSQVNAAKPQAGRSNDNKRLVWEFDSIAPGEEEEIQVQVTPTGEGVIDGVATVKFKSRVKATTTITAPRLQLQMEGPAKVRLGDKVQYRYVITNEGSGQARSVFVRTVLPQNGGLRHPQGQDLEYEIPLMEPGEQREILLSVVAGEPGNQQAQALVSSRNGSKDEATWSTDVVGAQLQMLRRGPKRRFVSKSARYENIVTNETDFDAVNARVVEKIPPGMEFKAAGQGGRYDSAERTVTWEIRRLGAKATTTLQLELEPRVAGQQDSRVTIFENIGAQSDDYVSTTVVEDLHNVSATISQLDGPIALGDVFGFTIAVDNRGTADATDIQLSVEVPAEIEVFGAGTKEVPAGLKRGTNTVVYQTVVRIKPDQQQDFEVKLRGVRPGRNKIVKASVKYTQMSEPLEISESVTIYDDRN